MGRGWGRVRREMGKGVGWREERNGERGGVEGEERRGRGCGRGRREKGKEGALR